MDPSTSIPAAPVEEPTRARDVGSTRQTYRPPRLMSLGNVDELLESLGPAQASYGDMGP